MKATCTILSAIIVSCVTSAFFNKPMFAKPEKEVAHGVAPSLTFAESQVHMVFSTGDSILYCFSTNQGESFSKPLFAGFVPNLSVGGGRGPQIISANGHLLIAVASTEGNLYTFTKKDKSSLWKEGARINDTSEIAKEAFVSLSSNRNGDVYAVWLDLRYDNKNKIVGAKSLDGGQTWSKNKIIYRSPDSTVCECCRPSVVMKDETVVVMFRNWLKGNRDMHVITSTDGGSHFGEAVKAGDGSWKLNGCPMDGGALIIDSDNTIHTVWRRQQEIFIWTKGKKEQSVTQGRQCVIAGDKGKHYIAFVDEGKIYCRKPDGNKVELGRGSYPDIVKTDLGSVVCAWEVGGRIYTASVK